MIRAFLEAYRKSFSGLPGSVWLLAVVTFVNRSGTMVVMFLALYLTNEKGWGVTEAGAVLGMYGTGAMAGAYLGGRLCDLMAPRRVMELSLALTGAGFFLLGDLDDPAAIMLAALAVGVVESALRPASGAALAEEAPPSERARAFALSRLAVNFGMTFGPAAGGFLAMRDYRWLFVVDGSTCLAAAALLWASSRRLVVGSGPVAPREEGKDRAPWHDGAYLAVLVQILLLAVVIFQTFSTWPLFLHERCGFTEARIGLLFSINTILIVVFQMLVIHAVRALDPMRVAGWGSLLFCAGFALLPLGAGYPFVAFTVVVWTMGEMLSLPMFEGIAANRATESNRGRYMGLLTVSFSAAFIVAPVIGTWIYQRLGPDALWYACGGVGLLLWAVSRALAAAGKGGRDVETLPASPS